jgi:hypothetical protein
MLRGRERGPARDQPLSPMRPDSVEAKPADAGAGD